MSTRFYETFSMSAARNSYKKTLTSIAVLAFLFMINDAGAFATFSKSIATRQRTVLKALSPRESDIRRKIAKFKKEGRLNRNRATDDEEDAAAKQQSEDSDEYARKIQEKLGKSKSKMLGFETVEDEDDDGEDDDVPSETLQRQARLGSLVVDENGDTVVTADDPSENEPITVAIASVAGKPFIDPSLLEGMDEDEDLSEEDLVELVSKKLLQEKQQMLSPTTASEKANVQTASATTVGGTSQLTSGVGGSWKKNETAEVEYYRPKSGSWGKFARPKDISKAYGGGRRIGPGYSNEERAKASVEETRKKLQEYREKVGIDVQSEKDHAEEIEYALKRAGYSMQRGMYTTAVSSLEQVSRYCSSNSKVGGKVFLELAMAYEATGKLEEAAIVYNTLTNCRIEEIKINAKRLLYRLEAMQFMRNNVKSSAFSRTKARNTFIDTTGLRDIAQNFDDVYNTAWIDTDTGFYKRLTQSVVRSPREARQVLLRAIGPGEVERLRIVQALRSLSRNFDDALNVEIEKAKEEEGRKECIAVIDGKPILRKKVDDGKDLLDEMLKDDFVLTSAGQMRENLSGEWRLQLLADKKGDGVKFFNTTLSTQTIDMERLQFNAEGANGLMSAQQKGLVDFDDKRRILRRINVETTGGGGVLAGLFGGTRSGAARAVSAPHQVISVDSVLLVTKRARTRKNERGGDDDERDFFAVWRRLVEDSPTIELKLDDRYINEMTT